jgi:hypothetical protein
MVVRLGFGRATSLARLTHQPPGLDRDRDCLTGGVSQGGAPDHAAAFVLASRSSTISRSSAATVVRSSSASRRSA